MTRAEIVAWSEEAGRKLTADRLGSMPLTDKQRARVKELRWEAAEYMRRQQNSVATPARPRRARRAATTG